MIKGGKVIVYIEDVFIENFLVTLLILLCMEKILKNNITKKRKILASIIGALFSLTYPLINSNLVLIYKLLAGVFIVMVAFGKKRKFSNYIIFLLFTALFGGANILMYYTVYGKLEIKDNFATHILILLLFSVYYIINSCLKLMQKNFVITNFVYAVKIINQDLILEDHAFLDSGNTLIDKKNNMPVFIINFKLFSKMYKDIKIEDILKKDYKGLKDPHYIKSGFASGSGKILIFTVDAIEININKNKKTIKNANLGLVYAQFNKNFNCNMLLNINAFV